MNNNKVWNISLEVGEKSVACTTLQFLLPFKRGSFLSFRGNARLPIAMSPERFHLILTETGAKKGGAKVTDTILSRRSEKEKKEEFCDSPCGLKTRNFCFSSPVTPDWCFFFSIFQRIHIAKILTFLKAIYSSLTETDVEKSGDKDAQCDVLRCHAIG